MIASRTAATRAAARTLRAPIRAPRQTRFASTTQSEAAKAGGVSGYAAGVAGGATVFLAGYSYYYFSGAKTVVDSYSATKSQIQKATKSIKEKAPEPNQAIAWLRNAASSYAAFIPGAQSYIDTAFDDLEKVQKKHGPEVEKIVNQTYAELKNVGKNGGMDMQTAAQSYNILQKAVRDIGELAKDSAEDLLDNHPQIKEKFGGNLDQLKRMADNYGPEAKKEVEDTIRQIQDILKGGMGVGAVNQARKLIQEKSDKVKGMGEQAWKKGLEEWKPYLDKSPKVKEIVEKNADSLKSGNVKEIFDQVRSAIESGSTDDLEKYIKDAAEKAKNSGMGQNIQQYAQMVPGGDQMWEKFQQLQQVAQDHGDEFQGLVKGAYEDISQVLQKRIAEAEKLKNKAERDAKR